MTTTEAIKQLQTEHDLIASERELDGSQFAPALLEALAMAIEVMKCSEIPNCSEPKCADGCIYGWGSSECGHCDYRSEEPKTGDTISRKAAIDVAIKADIENNDGVLSEKRARNIDKHISALPPAQPERPKDIIQNFHDYQVEWLKSHCDIELEPELEMLIVRFLNDTANCYIMEIERQTG